MARTRAAGHDNAYRAVPGGDLPGTPGRSARDGGPRHLFGIVAVAVVFALVGLTLWRPLSALVAVPLIAVLALIVRRAVPVPAAKAAAPARRPGRDGQARSTATASSRGVPSSRTAPARRPVNASRYDDRAPYDQEAELPTTATRRPATPAGRNPADVRYGRDDARDRHDEQEPRPRRATTPSPGFEPDYDHPRRAAARRPGDDQGRALPRDGARPAGQQRPGYADAPYHSPDERSGYVRPGHDQGGPAPDGRHPSAPGSAQPAARDPADGRYTGTGPGGAPTGGTGPGAARYEDARYGEAGYGGDPYTAGQGPAAYQRGPADEHHDQQPGYPAPRRAEYDGADGYDEYEDHDGDDQGEDLDDSGAETRRWRGWRRPDWDYDSEPEPEPNEDMMHTMALDMRGYLDDTGSFRMP
ncbi:hypothetical protein [Pseudofrankia sp. DC12]|uniref:hypothetical protein n=1 Tax=Pseudofrankia sp. DC12 TaxID=683315 RepID=UPI0005F88850|nr:hypothetical protein [Pseudofrankia sp. DC12]